MCAHVAGNKDNRLTRVQYAYVTGAENLQKQCSRNGGKGRGYRAFDEIVQRRKYVHRVRQTTGLSSAITTTLLFRNRVRWRTVE